MSEAAVEVKKSEPLFSKKNRRLVSDPLNDNNPITVQVLGICSALAVTSTVEKAGIMSICVVAVAALANLTISLIRNAVPGRIRMIVQLVVIATLVTMVSKVLEAFSFNVYKELSVFVGLIITNCIIMGRLEAFAMANKPWPSFLDGVGNGIGYGIILIAVAALREVFGSGSILGWQFSEGAVFTNGIMVLPIASIILIGVFIWVQRSMNKKLVDVS